MCVCQTNLENLYIRYSTQYPKSKSNIYTMIYVTFLLPPVYLDTMTCYFHKDKEWCQKQLHSLPPFHYHKTHKKSINYISWTLHITIIIRNMYSILYQRSCADFCYFRMWMQFNVELVLSWFNDIIRVPILFSYCSWIWL